jgi:hypothetical protein
MKKLILALLPIFFLTGCPKEKEEQEATTIMSDEFNRSTGKTFVYRRLFNESSAH